jgi:hypothetical protein
MAALKEKVFTFALNCQATPHLAIARVDARQIFAHSLVLLTDGHDQAFTVLQSRPHEIWARFMSSSMKDDLRYASSDCFETFPLPAGFESDTTLHAVGKAYYEHRAGLLIKANHGLTDTYNRFNRPDEQSSEIVELRRLHDQMDRAVLDAYGWQDLKPVAAYFSEFEDDDEQDNASAGRVKPKKFRYRWPDDVHDEVLARFLALNLERAALEHPPDTAISMRPKQGKTIKKPLKEKQPILF